MRKLSALLLLSSFPLLAQARTLYCQASFNTDVLFETEVTLNDRELNHKFGTLAGLEFYVSDRGQNKIELQVFNTYEPSRSYATSVFDKEGSHVELAVWKQDYMLEARCSN